MSHREREVRAEGRAIALCLIARTGLFPARAPLYRLLRPAASLHGARVWLFGSLQTKGGSFIRLVATGKRCAMNNLLLEKLQSFIFSHLALRLSRINGAVFMFKRARWLAVELLVVGLVSGFS